MQLDRLDHWLYFDVLAEVSHNYNIIRVGLEYSNTRYMLDAAPPPSGEL